MSWRANYIILKILCIFDFITAPRQGEKFSFTTQPGFRYGFRVYHIYETNSGKHFSQRFPVFIPGFCWSWQITTFTFFTTPICITAHNKAPHSLDSPDLYHFRRFCTHCLYDIDHWRPFKLKYISCHDTYELASMLSHFFLSLTYMCIKLYVLALSSVAAAWPNFNHLRQSWTMSILK